MGKYARKKKKAHDTFFFSAVFKSQTSGSAVRAETTNGVFKVGAIKEH